MSKPQQFPFARQSAGFAPPRRPGSIRRTTSIDSNWPQGAGRPWEMIGRARDLLTPAAGAPAELATGGFRILVSPQREILSVDITPDHSGAELLVGARAGGASRRTLAQAMGDLRGTPVYQLLDDFAGASLVAGWIWSLWAGEISVLPAGPRPVMVDICTGFAAGASSLDAEGGPRSDIQSSVPVGPLENPDDADGWHALPRQQGPQMRRARRLDLWREDGSLKVDAGFQDSGANPQGGRTAVHEYRLFATIDEASGTLAELDARPLVLPYPECPGASYQVNRLIGRRVGELREVVPEVLASTLGCTHLNDVLRGLADVPALSRRLPA